MILSLDSGPGLKPGPWIMKRYVSHKGQLQYSKHVMYRACVVLCLGGGGGGGGLLGDDDL